MTCPDARGAVRGRGVGNAACAAPAARAAGARARQGGSLALEAALILPLVALCAFALLHLVAVTRDAIAVQEAARVAARVAATDASDGAVRFAAVRVLGVGHLADATIEVRPSPRRAGDLVTVQVSVPSRFGPFRPVIRARAVSRGEPVLGGDP